MRGGVSKGGMHFEARHCRHIYVLVTLDADEHTTPARKKNAAPTSVPEEHSAACICKCWVACAGCACFVSLPKSGCTGEEARAGQVLMRGTVKSVDCVCVCVCVCVRACVRARARVCVCHRHVTDQDKSVGPNTRPSIASLRKRMSTSRDTAT
jgi:hypothetical protein